MQKSWIYTMQLRIRAWNSNIPIAVKHSLWRKLILKYTHMSVKMIWLTVWSHRRIWFSVGLVSLSPILGKPSARFSVNAEIVESLPCIIHESSLARETNLYVVRRLETASEETASEKIGGSELPPVNINRFPSYRLRERERERDDSASTFPTGVGSDPKFDFRFSIPVVALSSYNLYMSSPVSYFCSRLWILRAPIKFLP